MALPSCTSSEMRPQCLSTEQLQPCLVPSVEEVEMMPPSSVSVDSNPAGGKLCFPTQRESTLLRAEHSVDRIRKSDEFVDRQEAHERQLCRGIPASTFSPRSTLLVLSKTTNFEVANGADKAVTAADIITVNDGYLC
jgi:hypothetical protein